MLTDTAELHYQAWQKLADEEDIPFNRKANEALRGVTFKDIQHKFSFCLAD